MARSVKVKTLAEEYREHHKHGAIGDNTPPKARKTKTKHAKLKPDWQPGESGNPKGRPKGARNKLSEAFLGDLCKAWGEFGIKAISDVAKGDPASFLRVIASLVPKEVTGEGGGPLKIHMIPGDAAL